MRQDDDWKWHDIPCGSLSFHYNYICQFPLNKPGDVTGRVSSSAANQTHDNGYSTILAIIIGVSTTLLLIMGIIFLVLYWHDRKRKLKSNGALVHFSNNTYNGPLNGSTHPASHVPPIPTSPVPYSSDERLYLDPKENEDSKNNFQNISFSAKGRNCYQQRTRPSQPICSPPGTNLELGACGGSDAEKELQVPLMATAQKTNCELVETNCASSESLECCSLNHGEYIDMKSLAQKKDKSIKIDDGKHTYSNVDHRDSGIENLYEVLH
uniref:C-type lectin domain-containing protein n=1 Tax=Arion vulgaris TaxID=1028688 RepID=A0A0B7AHY7_9EUPU